MWATQNQLPGAPDCRSVVVPACEPDVPLGQTVPIDALALFQYRLRDTIDFSVDFSLWLAANGNPVLTGAAVATAAGSPSTPTVSGSSYAPGGKVVFVLTPTAGAKPGDAYFFDVTVTVGATTPQNTNDPPIPARSLTRRVNVVVIAG